MSVSAIIISGLAVGGTGILIGFILGIFGEKFKVEVDEREEAILEVLPREITAVDAVMQDVPVLRLQL